MCVDETNNVICATTVMSFKRGTFQRPLTLARKLAVQSETVDKALSEIYQHLSEILSEI